MVSWMPGLPFKEFYESISHNLALLTLLKSPKYYDRKISSTVVTSLVTGVSQQQHSWGDEGPGVGVGVGVRGRPGLVRT